MNITHYVCPRKCGKTTFARELQIKDPSLLLIERDCSITDMEKLFESFRGKVDRYNFYTGIIIDEFIPFTKSRGYSKGRLLSELKIMGIEEVFLISTPDKIYDVENNKDREEMIQKFLIDIPECENKINIIKTNFGIELDQNKKEEIRELLGEERFLTEYGEFLL